MTTQKSKVKANVNTFNLSKYQIEASTKSVPIKIEETGDEFNITVKQLSWSKRNQLISKALQFNQAGGSSFDGDLYVRECLKAMIVDAPWGRTTEAFLVSIDSRLGGALESIVPKAFGDDNTLDPDILKKG
tara:strand:+ start:2239 stop:2631 length:393 start_codon:yes stop_codon:yes gene_type:complete